MAKKMLLRLTFENGMETHIEEEGDLDLFLKQAKDWKWGKLVKKERIEEPAIMQKKPKHIMECRVIKI